MVLAREVGTPSAPARAIRGVTLARLRDTYPEVDSLFEASPDLRSTVALITHASPSLTRLLFVDSDALKVLGNLEESAAFEGDSVDSLVRWKQHEFLRVAARDLRGLDTLEQVGANLAALAEEVLRVSVLWSGAQELMAVISMGKLGGRELNYASDIDVMFIGEADERMARSVMEVARSCFRVDAALRPQGRDGPLMRSIESYESYWERWAQPWEFQALLKARPLAGKPSLQETWANAAANALWSRRFGADELRYLRTMKARVETLVAEKGLSEREVKRGRGGIRDVEFAVQLLQLVHGGNDNAIRSANTLIALDQLAGGGYITAEDSDSLGSSYRYLRTVEHRLQLVEQEQTHTIPTDRESRIRLASVMGYQDTAEEEALDQFEAELRSCQSNVRSAHERLYFRPLLEAFASSQGKTTEHLEERLSAFGFKDAARTRQAVGELTSGLARASRLMQQLLPLLLSWLSDAPDPDEGLLGLRKLIAGFRTPSHVVGVFRDSPEAARRVCLLLGTSRMFSDGFAKHPELLDVLANANELAPPSTAAERSQRLLEWKPKGEARQNALLRFTRSEQLRTSAADVLGLLADGEAGRRRSDLAETVLGEALREIDPSVPIALIGMGRFGGREMSYGSDLDVIVVHGGSGDVDQSSANAVAQELLHRVSGVAPANRLYSLDYDLRPEGKKGPVARSIEGCREYYENWAATWERQALVRARPVAGDLELGNQFLQTVQAFIWERPVDEAVLREVRHLKARMERERMPRGEESRFNLKLGPGSLSDVEWTVQLLQLENRVIEQNTLASLGKLEETGALASADREILETSWRFCDRVRNRWFIIDGGSSDSLPVNPERMNTLSRSLGATSVTLREEYLQVTRRARAVTERLFYGQDNL